METKRGQEEQSFERTIQKKVRGDYLLYLPPDYGSDESKRWPLVLFLHGAGERGSDVSKVALHGPPMLVAKGKEFPCIIVSPQCPEFSWWDHEADMLMGLLDEIGSRYKVDANRVYLTGLSMGGFGTWLLSIKFPERFAAIAPICGGGIPYLANLIKDIPMWAFHGAKDDAVPLQKSQEMVEAVKACGGDPKFTIYPEAGHDSWTEAYNSSEFWEWLFAQRKK